MMVTICELPDNDFLNAWTNLAKHIYKNENDIVLLPELLAYPWFAKYPRFNEKTWMYALKAHDVLINCLSDLNSAVISTCPIQIDNQRFNQAFCGMASIIQLDQNTTSQTREDFTKPCGSTEGGRILESLNGMI